MIWLLWKLVTLPPRLVLGALGLSFRVLRFVGLGRLVSFGMGVGAGMALAPTAGSELRSRLAQRPRTTGAVTGPDLADSVRHELAHSPRTWHLPQPAVAVDVSRVTLTGEVPHEEARAVLARTAGSVVGVTAVDNRITVAGSTPPK